MLNYERVAHNYMGVPLDNQTWRAGKPSIYKWILHWNLHVLGDFPLRLACGEQTNNRWLSLHIYIHIDIYKYKYKYIYIKYYYHYIVRFFSCSRFSISIRPACTLFTSPSRSGTALGTCSTGGSSDLRAKLAARGLEDLGIWKTAGWKKTCF